MMTRFRPGQRVNVALVELARCHDRIAALRELLREVRYCDLSGDDDPLNERISAALEKP